MPGVIVPDLDGGSGNPRTTPGAGDGGGTPGTPTGSTTASAPGENGGVVGSTWFLFVPVQDITNRCYFGFFDADSFDDTRDGSEYDYRVEDIAPDCVPTINWVLLEYRDLGRAKVTVVVQGVNDAGQVVSKSVQHQLGNLSPTNAILTVRIGIGFTAYRPQLKLVRVAGDGPLDIVRATMIGEVEDNESA